MIPHTFVKEPPAMKRDTSRKINKELLDKLTANPDEWYYYGKANRISFARALATYAKDWMIEMTARNVDSHGNGDIYLRFKP